MVQLSQRCSHNRQVPGAPEAGLCLGQGLAVAKYLPPVLSMLWDNCRVEIRKIEKLTIIERIVAVLNESRSQYRCLCHIIPSRKQELVIAQHVSEFILYRPRQFGR